MHICLNFLTNEIKLQTPQTLFPTGAQITENLKLLYTLFMHVPTVICNKRDRLQILIVLHDRYHEQSEIINWEEIFAM